MAPLTSSPFQPNKATSVQADLLGFLKRNAALIIGVGLFVTFWMLIYTYMVYKPGYAAKSMVIIKDSAITGRYIEPDQYYALQTTTSSSSNPVLNTMGILKSDAIRNALWEFFQKKHPEQLKKNNIETQQDWNAFFQDGSAFIKAKNQSGTDLIAVQFSWTDPLIAKEALGVVLIAFQNASRDLNRSEQTTRTRFLDKQVADIETQLTSMRNRKSAYQSTNGTVSVRREGDDLAGTRMELSNKLSQIEAQAQGKEKLMRRYQQLLGMTPEKALKASALGQNGAIARLQDELYRLEQQHSLLSASLTETNPKVQEIEAQITQVKANLEAEETRTLGSAKANPNQSVVADSTRSDLVRSMLIAQGEAQDLRAQAAVTRNRLGQINSDISGFPQKAEGLAQLEQKEASLSTALDHLRQKALEGRLKEEQTLSNVFIVDQPSLPESAQFPNRTHLAILSLLMGLGVGVATAFAKEQLSSPTASYGMPQWLAPLDDDTHETNKVTENDHTTDPAPFIGLQPAHPQNAGPVFPLTVDEEATLTPPLSPREAMMSQQPVSDKVSIPAIGSLFDSLVPVAGPMLHQQVQPPEFREDLTRALPPQFNSQPASPHPEVLLNSTRIDAEASPLPVSEPTAIELLQPDFKVEDALLSPHPQIMPPTPTPAKSVRVAATPSPITVARAQASHQENATLPMMNLEGIPVLHATPTLSGQSNSDFLDSFPMPEPAGLDSARPIAYEPIQYKAPSQINVTAEAPTPSTPVDDAASDHYENQALQMPLPRRMRSMPAFLMGSEGSPTGEASATEQPYTLVPRKQLLSADEDLTQEVSPLTAPSPQAQASEMLPFPETVSGESFRPRKPLLESLGFGKKPAYRPEIYSSVQDRKKKQAPLPTSINRLMAAIQDSPNSRKR
ncbi:hypothetical protein [Vampirovibrio sp.]|uniref:hypothetical protein n=1 Tax=Vampirovibrio sp. TaxID=2717857 RepID=UPI0035941423